MAIAQVGGEGGDSMQLTKIRELNEFIHKKPPLGILISYLSNNVSPLGLQIGITSGVLYDANLLVCENAYGFDDNKALVGLSMDLFDATPIAESMRTNKIIFGKTADAISTRKNVSSIIEILYPYYSVIPIHLNRYYAFAFPAAEEELISQTEYFKSIRSILEIYHTISKGIDETSGQAELTKRQREIYELIRQNLKNHEIAEKMGYSESLIRQETVVIYRLMGVQGRKDLVSKNYLAN